MTKADLEKIWSVVVISEFRHLNATFPGLYLYEGSKDDFFCEYEKIKEHCKDYYMKNSEKLVDRHKVCAAMMISILKIEPIKMSAELYQMGSEYNWLFNEKLAISVGMSVLKAFINTANEHNTQVLNKIEKGIAYPKTNHGEFANNFAVELYYTRKENSYNLLALANELFLLETYTLMN